MLSEVCKMAKKLLKCSQNVAKTRWWRKRKNANNLIFKLLAFSSCGADGTRTRDPMRDRHVF